ncbi:MAG TPA: AarF/UbiB family protein [Rhodothermales bacterium]|nr:AarF/UbiB family protein [Rhodothermales bacterium]
MNLSLKPSHLSRYKDIARLLLKHGGSNLVSIAGLDEALVVEESFESQQDGEPEQLAKDLEALGPTFIKLGQMLSTRPDLLPLPYLEALSRLQDKVDSFSFAEVERIVEQELGVRISKAFQQLNAEPLAAASLGQVHAGILRDGKPVVVKVQRPGIRERILEDLDALDEVTTFVDAHTEAGRRFAFSDLLEQFRKTLLRELDYRQEAQNLIALGENLAAYNRIVVPQPIHDYSTARVLTMDYVQGTKITEISPLTRIEVDGEVLAKDLLKAYLDQILADGFFHADPHPGNVFLTTDHRIALLDLGMVARLDDVHQQQLLKLLLTVADGKGREAAEVCIEMGHPLEDFDRKSFTREIADLVGRFRDAPIADLQVGRITMELTRIAGENGLRPAPETTMLGKTLLNLDEIGRTLDPAFNPNAVVRSHANALMQRRMLKSLSPGKLFTTMLETHELVQTLPRRINKLFDALANNSYTLRIDAFDEYWLVENFHRMTNRLSISMVLAALIIGAALMMRVETTFTILGYPGLAMLFFLLAAACGFVLVISIYLSDRRDRESK